MSGLKSAFEINEGQFVRGIELRCSQTAVQFQRRVAMEWAKAGASAIGAKEEASAIVEGCDAHATRAIRATRKTRAVLP